MDGRLFWFFAASENISDSPLPPCIEAEILLVFSLRHQVTEPVERIYDFLSLFDVFLQKRCIPDGFDLHDFTGLVFLEPSSQLHGVTQSLRDSLDQQGVCLIPTK